MRFGRFQGTAGPFWAVVDLVAGTARPIDEPFVQWTDKFSRNGAAALKLDKPVVQLSTLKLLAPFEPGSRVFGCGGNYWDHLKKTGLFTKVPEVPVAYFKIEESVIGSESVVRYPSYTNKLDYEVELVAVLGRPLVRGETPSRSLLGYSIGNDISIRDTQDPFGTPDLYTMKGADAMSPVGPHVVSIDEVGGTGQPELDISLSINGEQRQHDNTRNVIFSIDHLLTWVNERNALRAGDIIYTGSPAGAATEEGQGKYMMPGDVVEAKIEKIGVLRNTIGKKEANRM